MITAVLTWFKSLFASKVVGIITKMLISNATATLAKEIFDEENQRKAYEFVKELNADTTLNNYEKAKLFNKKMAQWALVCGRKIATSAINCLRELAVNAIKDENALLEQKKNGND